MIGYLPAIIFENPIEQRRNLDSFRDQRLELFILQVSAVEFCSESERGVFYEILTDTRFVGIFCYQGDGDKDGSEERHGWVIGDDHCATSRRTIRPSQV